MAHKQAGLVRADEGVLRAAEGMRAVEPRTRWHIRSPLVAREKPMG